jgi:hypothetical protein
LGKITNFKLCEMSSTVVEVTDSDDLFSSETHLVNIFLNTFNFFLIFLIHKNCSRKLQVIVNITVSVKHPGAKTFSITILSIVALCTNTQRKHSV